MSRFSPPHPADVAARERQIKAICEILRGNCPCGKWLVLVPSAYPKGKPFVCEGPCHANKKCGHTYFYEDGGWKGSAINAM